MAEGGQAPRPPLVPISGNCPPPTPSTRKRKLLTGGTSTTLRNPRKTIECLFPGTPDEARAERAEMEAKISQVKVLLGGANDITTKDMIMALLDSYLAVNDHSTASAPLPLPKYQSISDQNRDREGQKLFIAAEDSIRYLILNLHEHAQQCREQQKVRSLLLRGHTGIFTMRCRRGHGFMWTSSPHIGKPFLVNLRMAHGYMSSGMLPNQYKRLCANAGIGQISDANQRKSMILYADIASDQAKASMMDAITEEIGEQPAKRLSIVTDARHAQRKNSHRSDIMALGQNNHKVVAYAPITKQDLRSSNQHEVLGTERLYKYFDELGLQIVDHAHDRQASVNKIVKDRPPLADGTRTTNSNDTWHATKNIPSKFKELTKGARWNVGITWHPELVDKAAAVKTHFYWSMSRCGGSEQVLRDSLMNIVAHYRNQHDNCSPESRCRTDDRYRPTKLIIRNEGAIELLTKFIQKHTVYKWPCDYVLCKDTLYVESFNNACLQYLDKRIFFGTLNYGLRMNLAILDWNEHVDRPATSRYQRFRVANPRQNNGGKRVLVAKTYRFLQELVHTFLGRVRTAGDLPALPPGRQPNQRAADGDRLLEDDYSSAEEDE
ncbi:uncharacterized protein LOC144885371 [Branchiostoma floridae x Branchiostoma japonicum]